MAKLSKSSVHTSTFIIAVVTVLLISITNTQAQDTIRPMWSTNVRPSKSYAAMFFNKNGSRLVTTNADNSVTVWNTETGQILSKVRQPDSPDLKSNINSKGNRIFTFNLDGQIVLLDTETGNQIASAIGQTAVFNKSGDLILAGKVILNSETGEIVKDLSLSIFDQEIRSKDSFSDLIVTVNSDFNNKNANVYDFTGRIRTQLFGAGRLWATFNNTGTSIVIASSKSTVNTWDSKSGDLLATFNSKKEYSDIWNLFTNNGNRVITTGRYSTGEKGSQVWDVKTGQLVTTIDGFCTSSNYTDQYLLTIHPDSSAKVWNTETGTLLTTIKGADLSVSYAKFFPTDNRIAVGCTDGSIKIVDCRTGYILSSFDGHIGLYIGLNSAQFAENDDYIVTASRDRTAIVWDSKTGLYTTILKGHNGSVLTAKFNPSGDRIITASEDSTAIIWDTKTGKILNTLKGHISRVTAAEFNSTNNRIVTAGDTTAKLWDAQSGSLIANVSGHRNGVVNAFFTEAGDRFVTAGYDSKVNIYNSENGSLILSVDAKFTSSFESGAFNLVGNRLLTVSGGSVRIWDIQTGKKLEILNGHKDGINTVSFNKNGDYVVSASKDGTAKIWNAENGSLIATLKDNSTRIQTAYFSPDGKYVVTASDSSINIWRADATGQLVASLISNCIVEPWLSNNCRRFAINAMFSHSGKHVLAMYDSDGAAKMWDVSNVVTSVPNEDKSEFIQPSISVSPNPTQDELQITYTITETSITDVFVTDVLGNRVATVRNTVSEHGMHQELLSTNNWSNGTYFVVVSNGISRFTQPFIVVH